jgi:hypothetical protein
VVTTAGTFAPRPRSQADLGYVAARSGRCRQPHEAFWSVGHGRLQWSESALYCSCLFYFQKLIFV